MQHSDHIAQIVAAICAVAVRGADRFVLYTQSEPAEIWPTHSRDRGDREIATGAIESGSQFRLRCAVVLTNRHPSLGWPEAREEQPSC